MLQHTNPSLTPEEKQAILKYLRVTWKLFNTLNNKDEKISFLEFVRIYTEGTISVLKEEQNKRKAQQKR